MDNTPILRIENLFKQFPVPRTMGDRLKRRPSQVVHAIDGVSFDVNQGEILALVGESGSGKTTVGMNVLGLQVPTHGRILFDGQDVAAWATGKLKSGKRRGELGRLSRRKQILALRRRGVRYVEVRSLDVDPFEPLGMSEEQLDFMDVFMRFCLFADSPRIAAQERRAIDENQVLTAHRGRDPNLELLRDGQRIQLRSWALELMDAMESVAELMDGASEGACRRSLRSQHEKVLDPDRTPSARVLAEMRANGEGFFHFAQRVSESHRDYFLSSELDSERDAFLRRLSEESMRRQGEIEEEEDMSFEAFLERYFAQKWND